MCVEPLPKSREEHKVMWESLKRAIENAVQVEVEVDKQCKNINRLCYLAYDPNCYVNADAMTFGWDNTSEEESVPPPRKDDGSRDPSKITDVAVAREVLKFVSADDRETWINVGHAAKHEGLPFSVWDEWSRTSSKFNPAEDMQARWDGFKPDGGIKWGSVVHMAKEKGYTQRGGKRKGAGRKTNAQKSQEAKPIETGRPTIFLNTIKDTGGDLVYSDRPRFRLPKRLRKYYLMPRQT